RRTGWWTRGRPTGPRACRVRPRPSGVGPGVLPGIAGRRARGALAARADVRGAGTWLLREDRGPRERRPAPEQPRRPQLHPRQSGTGGRAALERAPDRARG